MSASAWKNAALAGVLFFSLSTETLHADLTAHFTLRPCLAIGSCLSIDIIPEAKRIDSGNKLTKSTPLLRSLGQA
jgi:hypothetical protein